MIVSLLNVFESQKSVIGHFLTYLSKMDEIVKSKLKVPLQKGGTCAPRLIIRKKTALGYALPF